MKSLFFLRIAYVNVEKYFSAFRIMTQVANASYIKLTEYGLTFVLN